MRATGSSTQVGACGGEARRQSALRLNSDWIDYPAAGRDRAGRPLREDQSPCWTSFS